jgi:hypothetical protein
MECFNYLGDIRASLSSQLIQAAQRKVLKQTVQPLPPPSYNTYVSSLLIFSGFCFVVVTFKKIQMEMEGFLKVLLSLSNEPKC